MSESNTPASSPSPASDPTAVPPAAPTPVSTDQPAGAKESSRLKKREYPALILTTLSIMGVVAALFGQGVMLAVNDRFGTFAQLGSDSPFDLIEASMFGIAGLDSNLDLVPSIWEMLISVNKSIWWMSLLVAVMTFFIIRAKPAADKKIAKGPWRHGWLFNPLGNESVSKSSWKSGLAGLVWGAIVHAFSSLFVVGVMITAIVTLIAFQIVPMIGYASANVYIDKFVLGNAQCLPLAHGKSTAEEVAEARHAAANASNNNDEKKPIYFANCIAIKSRDTGKEYIRGIVVLPTSSAVILYNPMTKVTDKVPTKDAMIETVETLTPPQDVKAHESSPAATPSSTVAPAPATGATQGPPERDSGKKL